MDYLISSGRGTGDIRATEPGEQEHEQSSPLEVHKGTRKPNFVLRAAANASIFYRDGGNEQDETPPDQDQEQPQHQAPDDEEGNEQAGDAPSTPLWGRTLRELGRILRGPFGYCVFSLAAIFLYILMGAAIFKSFEYDTEKKRIQSVIDKFYEAAYIWDELGITEGVEAYGTTAEDFYAAIAGGVNLELNMLGPEYENVHNVWELETASFFAATIVTTVGYGSFTPSTKESKGFFPLYAIIGIGLFGVWLSAVTNVITRAQGYLGQFLRSKFGLSSVLVGATQLLVTAVTILVCFIYAFSFVFVDLMAWSYTDSMYFSWVSATTVGFGDFYPSPKHWGYNMLAIFYLLFSLAFVAALINDVLRVATLLATRTKQVAKSTLSRTVSESQMLKRLGSTIGQNSNASLDEKKRKKQIEDAVQVLNSLLADTLDSTDDLEQVGKLVDKDGDTCFDSMQFACAMETVVSEDGKPQLKVVFTQQHPSWAVGSPS